MPIDLRSDTVTRPSEQMREAAATAEVGDDVYREDPTVTELETRAAEAVGKEAGLFVPSGTMGNQVAAKTHTQPGEEVLVELESHIYRWELGGLAQHAGLQVRTIDAGPRGALDSEQVRSGYVAADAHRPGTGLLCLENTHNARGGTAIDSDRLDAAASVAHDLDVAVHLDGARLFNAAAALDVTPRRLAAGADSVMFCLSKGLGAPVGSILAGSREFIEAARRTRKLFGGGMRQVGMMAAPGLVALDNADRLGTDHAHARRLASGLRDVAGLSPRDPETNILLVETADAAESVLEQWADVGILGVPFGEHLVRLCTHLDVSEADVDEAIDRIAGLDH